jgi:AcrR family transcriptional regulator
MPLCRWLLQGCIERLFIYFRPMARPTGSNAEITGPRIRAAAIRLFARHGFAAVSMRQIAAEVGVQAGALYLYTVDKETLLFDLLRTHMEDLIAVYDARCVSGTPDTRLEDFVGFHIAYNLDHPDEVFLSYMELRNLSVSNFAVIEGMRRDYEDRLHKILAAGQAAGQFALPDPKLATLAIIAMLNGVNTWYRADGRLSRDAVVLIYRDMVRKALAA